MALLVIGLVRTEGAEKGLYSNRLNLKLYPKGFRVR